MTSCEERELLCQVAEEWKVLASLRAGEARWLAKAAKDCPFKYERAAKEALAAAKAAAKAAKEALAAAARARRIACFQAMRKGQSLPW